MKLTCKMTLLFLFLFSSPSYARDHLIFSIGHAIPMGYPNEVVKKNYYVNMGSNQGVKKGAVLNVYRTISRLNPYADQQRINYRVKIGELNVLHSEDEAAIGELKLVHSNANDVLFDVNDFMIGDYVSVKIRD